MKTETVLERIKQIEKPVNWNHPAAVHATIIDAEQGIVEVVPRRKKVAIVGFATTHRWLAPYEDPSWEIWSLNQMYRFTPRADRWFETHQRNVFLADVVRDTDYLGWLQTAKIPVYMLQTFPDMPNSVRYPIERVIDKFGDYYQSTIAYMLALAALEGFEEVAIYGIDLVVGEEYDYQKPNAEYLIGFMLGLGIKIHLPEGCALTAQSHRYGYQVAPDTGLISLAEINERILVYTKKRDDLLALVRTLDGTIQESEFYRDVMKLRMRGSLAGRNLDPNPGT